MQENTFGTILSRHEQKLESLLAILQDIQAEFHYIPENALKEISTYLNTSLTHIYAVTTFYNAFSLKPKGQYEIQVCMGTACHVRTAPLIVEEIERVLNIRKGETSADNRFSLETVNCLGACALGPIMVINGEYYSNLDPEKTREILETYRKS